MHALDTKSRRIDVVRLTILTGIGANGRKGSFSFPILELKVYTRIRVTPRLNLFDRPADMSWHANNRETGATSGPINSLLELEVAVAVESPGTLHGQLGFIHIPNHGRIPSL